VNAYWTSFRCVDLAVTTNYKSDGIYLPSDDRRHFVAWSNLTKEDFTEGYWNDLWKWYGKGGIEAVVDHLSKFDLSKFDAKAPPPKTPAFWDIVDANRAPEDAELADALDAMSRPSATTVDRIATFADAELGIWIRDSAKTSRARP
jgi:hypothetical protein